MGNLFTFETREGKNDNADQGISVSFALEARILILIAPGVYFCFLYAN